MRSISTSIGLLFIALLFVDNPLFGNNGENILGEKVDEFFGNYSGSVANLART